MAKRKPRLISRAAEEAIAKKRTEAKCQPPSLVLVPSVPRQKTEIERIYDLIDDACSDCWRFTDDEGRPWIDKDDVENKGGGIYLVRFRCPIEAMQTRTAFDKVVEKVCRELRSEIRYFCKVREERYTEGIRLFYEDCAWVINVGELDEKELIEETDNCESCIDTQEEIEGELADESTAEEIEERIGKAMENFV